MRVISWDSDSVTFDNGDKIVTEHEQDCCENVFASFKALDDTSITWQNFEKIEIELVENTGFRLNGYFIPCYSIQNGYYSDNLKLHITENGVTRTLDITEAVFKDHS